MEYSPEDLKNSHRSSHLETAGVLCQVKVSELKPTQNAVGFDEVNDKIARYSAKSKADLKDYLLVHPVPVCHRQRWQILFDRSSPFGECPVEDGRGQEQGGHRYQERARCRQGATHIVPA